MSLRRCWALLLSVPISARAGEPPPLFTAILDASPNPPERTLSAFPVQVNFPALDANPPNISVELPGAGTFTATRSSFETTPDGGYHWIGKTSIHDVVLTVDDNLITGFIRGGDDTYSIVTALDGGGMDTQSLQRMDAAAFPGDVTEPLAPAGMKLHGAPKGATAAVPERTCFGATAEPIDVLVVYSPQALAAAGGNATVLENQIDNAITAGTVTLANSDVPAELRLARIEPAPLSLNEVGTTNDYFNALNNADLAVRRRLWSADVVTYLTSVGMNGPNAYCGVTRAMRLGGTLGFGYDYAPFAYNVVTWQCGVQNNDLSHETGHNVGLDHNPGFTSGTPQTNLYPYAFGHSVDGFFRDDMSGSSAASCPLGCPRQMFFSNPGQQFSGMDRGITNARDNAQTYRRMFRCVNTFADFVFVDGFE